MKTPSSFSAPLLLLALLSAPTLGAAQPLVFEVSDGAEIAYQVRGNGPPVVFLHGFMGTMELWNHIVEPLAGRFTVVVLDLRGHGRSTNPGPDFDHRRFALDAVELMDELAFREFGVVGHSAGGVAALHLASMHPDRVLWQIVIGASPRLGKDAREYLGNYPELDGLEAGLRDYLLEAHPGGRAQVRELLRGMRAYGSPRADVDFDAESLGRIDVPTLVVWGDRDGNPVELAVQLYREIPEAWLWVVPGAGHQLFWPRFGGSLDAARELGDRLRDFAETHGG